MEKEEESKQVIAAIFGTIEGMDEMELGPSEWMKDVIKGINACRKGRGDDVTQKVNDEGIKWLLNKENYAWAWGKGVEYERSYEEWKYGEDGEEDEMEEEDNIEICEWTMENGNKCEYEGTKREVAHHKHYAHGVNNMGKECIITNYCPLCETKFDNVANAKRHGRQTKENGRCPNQNTWGENLKIQLR